MAPVPILCRTTGPVKRNLSHRVMNAIFERSESLTGGLLAAEVRKTGREPEILNLRDISEVEGCTAPVALLSINDPSVLYTAVKNRELLRRNFGALLIGGQIPGIAPAIVQRQFPEALIFCGECEGLIDELIRKAESGFRGIEKRNCPPDIYASYTRPERTAGPKVTQMMELGRGCPYGCDFCGMPKGHRKVRTRNPDDAIDEISRLGRRILFVDPNLSAYPPEYLERIFDYMLKTDRIWAGEGTTRELVAQPEIWDLMSRTCLAFLTGIENPNPEDYSRVKHGPTRLPPRNGVVILSSLIIGSPGQTEQDVQNIIGLARKANLNASLHICAPYPGTPAFGEIRRSGGLLERNFVLFDRRHVVVKSGMTPEKTIESYHRAEKESQTLRGTLKEVLRVLKESTGFMRRIYRIATVLLFRLKNWYNSKQEMKNEMEVEGTNINIPVD